MSRQNRIAAGLALLFVVVMPSGVAWLIWRGLPAPRDMSEFAGAFGDITGPLFAALAFAGLIYTALMQREELSLQRQELRETREELRRAADAQEKSEATLEAQLEAMKRTAHLNGLTALLNSLNTQSILKGMIFSGEKANIVEKQLRTILESLEQELRGRGGSG